MPSRTGTKARKPSNLGHFDEAKQKLARAASAFERLGIRDERATHSRQLSDEAAILADRCPLKLDELIEEAARYTPAEEWPSHFATIYKGQSIIFDTMILATPADSGSGAYEIDYRIFSGRGPLPSRQGRIDLKGFQLFETLHPRAGESKIFGARLDTLTSRQRRMGRPPRTGQRRPDDRIQGSRTYRLGSFRDRLLGP